MMCTPGIESTSLIARVLAVEYGFKCNSVGRNLKSEICLKVFEPPFVYTVKVSSEVQSQIFPIFYLLFHTLEAKQVSRSIHELGIFLTVL